MLFKNFAMALMLPDELDVFSSEFNIDFDDDIVELPTDATEEDEMLWVAQRGMTDRAKELLDKNPGLVKCQDRDGYSPLHRASYSDRPEMVDLLLSRGAPVDLKTTEGWLPLHSASKWGHHECALKLLMHGSPINAVSEGGQTPLHLAATCRTDTKCLKLLLSWPGVSYTILNKQGETAYDVAKRNIKHHHIFDVIKPCYNEISNS